jgi:hypothetical protein
MVLVDSWVRLEAPWHPGLMVLVGVIADWAGRAGRSAATLHRPEPQPIGMGLTDPSAVVASGTELHGYAYMAGEGFVLKSQTETRAACGCSERFALNSY